MAFLKSDVPASAKVLDKDLAKVQSFLLDTLAPILSILEHNMTPSEVYEAVMQLGGSWVVMQQIFVLNSVWLLVAT